MNKPLDKKMAIVVIVLSTILMQIHSIEYWTGVTESYGVAWSIALEAAMLWLWYQKRLFLIRVLAAMILIAGPWYVLTEPAIESLQEKVELRNQILSAQGKVERLTASLIRYETNSAGRLGWSGRIDRTMTKLELAEKDLQRSRKKAASLGFEWRLYMVAGMQASILFIVMITQLLAVAGLRDSVITKVVSKESKGPPKLRPTPKPASGTTEYDRAVEAVVKAIKAKPGEFGKTQNALAEYFDIRPADITMLFKHIEKRAAGSETISKVALQKMVAKLKIDKGEYQRA